MPIFIKHNIPSSKNSRVNTSKGSFHSKTVMKFLRELGIQHYSVRDKIVKGYARRPNEFESYREDFMHMVNDINKSPNEPLKIGFHFVRGSKHKADFHNLVQIVADLMVAHNFIEDDNMECFLPFPLKIYETYWSYNKENPGVWIEILK